MAGDWIKFEKATLDKPEVFEMAEMLGIDPDAVVGKLLRVWNWFDDQSHDGDAPVTVRALLDRYTGVTGFTQSMESVGWLRVDGKTISLPNFERHNGQTAKNRALTAKRMAKSRSKSDAKSDAPIVTPSSPEKRIEEKRLISVPTEEEFTFYLVAKLPDINPDWTTERATRAAKSRYETYTADGWKDGNGKTIKNWKTKSTNAIKHEKPWNYGTDKTSRQPHHHNGSGRTNSSSSGGYSDGWGNKSAGDGIKPKML